MADEPMKRLAPYAKLIPQKTKDIWIYSGPEAWRRAQWRVQQKLPVLVLAPGNHPASYRWPVYGADVTVVDSGCPELTLEALAHNLLTAGANLVCVIHGANRKCAFFHQTESCSRA